MSCKYCRNPEIPADMAQFGIRMCEPCVQSGADERHYDAVLELPLWQFVAWNAWQLVTRGKRRWAQHWWARFDQNYQRKTRGRRRA